MLLDAISNAARAAAVEAFGTDPGPIPIDFPENAAFGDFSLNCFHLAKSLRRAPPALALELAEKLAGRAPVETATAVSGYVNLTVARPALFASAMLPMLQDPAAIGRGSSLAGRRLLVEFSAPNTNKPQHLGHLRNNFLGDTVARLLANAGAHVTRVNLVNDRGIHICKSMIAYERFGGGATPASTGKKGDHFVGDFYVRFEAEFQKEVEPWLASHEDEYVAYAAKHAVDRKGKPRSVEDLRKEWRASYKEENFGRIPLGAAAQEMLRKWEADDPKVVELWKLMNGWVLEGFDATYRRLGITFDRVYYESQTWRLGRDLILEAVERGVFSRRADGAVECDLSAHGLGKKVVLRSDGTSVYMTQDIGTTVMKANEWKADGQTWVVADEQRHHFAVLFKILELMGYPWARSLHHLAYGLVNLPEGRMKSREGTVVDADDLLDEVESLAREEIVGRDSAPTGSALEDRAARIALAALRFMLLKVSPTTTMIYNPKESVSFEGETGPYLLYTYARIRRMLADGSRSSSDTVFDHGVLGTATELALARVLLRCDRATERAAREFNPAIVTAYLFELAQAYNSYYQDVPILKAPTPELREARLALSAATANVIFAGCALLGIPTIDRM